MFGRDAILPLNKLLQPQVQYLGNDENILLMQALKNIYEVVAQNLKNAHAKITDNDNPVLIGSKIPLMIGRVFMVPML